MDRICCRREWDDGKDMVLKPRTIDETVDSRMQEWFVIGSSGKRDPVSVE